MLLTCWQVVQACALRMTWKGRHPNVHRLEADYSSPQPLTDADMKSIVVAESMELRGFDDKAIDVGKQHDKE